MVDPAGYVSYNGAYYKKFEDSLTFGEAEWACIQEGGHLASIHSLGEQQFIMGTL